MILYRGFLGFIYLIQLLVRNINWKSLTRYLLIRFCCVFLSILDLMCGIGFLGRLGHRLILGLMLFLMKRKHQWEAHVRTLSPLLS